jgi:hypothetical protein
MSHLLSAFPNINVPKQVKIVPTDSIDALFAEIGRRSVGQSGPVFFGTAFVQGERLQFTTAMPVRQMIEVTKIDRSKKKDPVMEAMEHSNRPEEQGHAKAIRAYLLSTACIGEKFILPAFTFNYGVGLDEDSPIVTLMLFGATTEGANTWPGILCLPPNAKLDNTDGAHRRSQIDGILSDPKIDVEKKDALRNNAVDVKIVFECSRPDSHQDFADCGKAKAIAKSLVTTFDVRDERNQRSRDLVVNTPFLRAYVDATASNVNLSARSRKIWSMTAVRSFIAFIVDSGEDGPESTTKERTDGAEDFIVALIRHLPQLRALDKVKDSTDPEVTAGQYRETRGGDIALRGVGMSIFARAFVYCRNYQVSFDDMASRLATVDWHLLNQEREDLPNDPTQYMSAVQKAVLPMWAHMIAVFENGYRVRTSAAEVDEAWRKMEAQLFATNADKAA